MPTSPRRSAGFLLRTRGALRGAFACVAAVSCLLLTPLALTVSWASHTVLNTNGYVATVEELPRRPSVANAIAQLVVDQAEQRAPLAQVWMAGVRGPLVTAVNRAVGSRQFDLLWTNANRTSHLVMLAAVSDQDHDTETASGNVVLDVGATLTLAADQTSDGLLRRVITGLAAVATQKKLTVNVPVTVKVFVDANRVVRAIRFGAWALWMCWIAAAAATLLLAARRERMLVILAEATALICGVFAAIVKLGPALAPLPGNAASATIATAFSECLVAPLATNALIFALVAAFGAVLTSLHLRRNRRRSSASLESVFI